MSKEITIDIAPCIGVSNQVNLLKRFKITLVISDSIQAWKGNLLLFKTKSKLLTNPHVDWYGDLLQIKDLNSDTRFTIGIQNKTLFINSYPKIKMFKNILSLMISRIKINVLKNPRLIENLFEASINWKNNSPHEPKITAFQTPSLLDGKCREYGLYNEELYNIWEDTWVYHRYNQFYPELIFSLPWISPCRDSPIQNDMLAMWDTLHVIEDLKYYDETSVLNMLDLHFDMFRDTDGMCAQDQKLSRAYKKYTSALSTSLFSFKKEPKLDNIPNYNLSQPPLWCQVLRDLVDHSESYAEKIGKNIGLYMEKMQKNITWWEENRYFKEYSLFGYPLLPTRVCANESGLDNSPRFYNQFNVSTGEWTKLTKDSNRNLICVDLSAQMLNYYENMVYLIQKFELGSTKEYELKISLLREHFFSTFWDETTGFFYDFDVDMDCLQPIMASSHFWAYYAFNSIRGDYIQLKKLNHHLLNHHKFLTPMPIPTISIDSPFYTNNMWQGPVWVSQNYWILKCLKNAKQGAVAYDLACRTIGRLSLFYSSYHKIYEFYPPESEDISSLQRKNSPKGPYPHYIGHMPLHAMYYEFIDTEK